MTELEKTIHGLERISTNGGLINPDREVIKHAIKLLKEKNGTIIGFKCEGMTEEKLHEIANYLYRLMASFDYSSLSEFIINLSFRHDTFWIDTDVKSHEAIRFKDVESVKE